MSYVTVAFTLHEKHHGFDEPYIMVAMGHMSCVIVVMEFMSRLLGTPNVRHCGCYWT